MYLRLSLIALLFGILGFNLFPSDEKIAVYLAPPAHFHTVYSPNSWWQPDSILLKRTAGLIVMEPGTWIHITEPGCIQKRCLHEAAKAMRTRFLIYGQIEMIMGTQLMSWYGIDRNSPDHVVAIVQLLPEDPMEAKMLCCRTFIDCIRQLHPNRRGMTNRSVTKIE